MVSENEILKWTKFANSSTKKMVRFIRTLEPEFKNFTVKPRFYWGKRRQYHLGGYEFDEAFILLVMRRLLKYKLTWEYPRYYNQRDIGCFWHTDKKVTIEACIAHELAHCICMKYFDNCTHDKQWRHYYRILRNKYTNQHVTDRQFKRGLKEIGFGKGIKK